MRLSAICSIQSGLSLRTGLDVSDKGILAVQPSDLGDDGQLSGVPKARIASAGVLHRHAIGTGDVLFKSRGVRHSAWAVSPELEEPAVALMPLFVLRPLANVVDPVYLAWVLNQPPAERHFSQGATGTTVRTVNKPILESLEVALPSLETQRHIGALVLCAAEERNLLLRISKRRSDLLNRQLADLVQNSTQSHSGERPKK